MIVKNLKIELSQYDIENLFDTILTELTEDDNPFWKTIPNNGTRGTLQEWLEDFVDKFYKETR